MLHTMCFKKIKIPKKLLIAFYDTKFSKLQQKNEKHKKKTKKKILIEV